MGLNEFSVFFVVSIFTLNCVASFYVFKRNHVTGLTQVLNLLVIWLLPVIGLLVIALTLLVYDPAIKKKAKKGYRKVSVNDPGGNKYDTSVDGD